MTYKSSSPKAWFSNSSKNLGSDIGEGMVSGIEPALERLPSIAAKATEESLKQLRDSGSRAVRNVSGMAAVGALAGMATAGGEIGSRSGGAQRGILGGILGGLGGVSWGRNMPSAMAGAALGGAIGGLAARVDRYKYAGVVIDYFDDNGDLLGDLFPDSNTLPELIKSASVPNSEYLTESDFALTMIDQGEVFNKFACVDGGTTAMSVIYFMENKDKLSEDAQKTAASNLVEYCGQFGLAPPEHLTEISAGTVQPPLDITGEKTATIRSNYIPQAESDFAIVLPSGVGKYPIDTIDNIKVAEAYWADHQHEMPAPMRREYAVKLANKAASLNYHLDNDITVRASDSYLGDGGLQYAIEMRKVACAPGPEREFLDELFDKRASVQPEVYAECLRQFDVENGLDSGWGHLVLDPWESTFGEKTASVVWEDGVERVTSTELRNLAEQGLGSVKAQFTEGFAEEFSKDPVVMFNSMPAPQKKILARMANDTSSRGGVEKVKESARMVHKPAADGFYAPFNLHRGPTPKGGWKEKSKEPKFKVSDKLLGKVYKASYQRGG